MRRLPMTLATLIAGALLAHPRPVSAQARRDHAPGADSARVAPADTAHFHATGRSTAAWQWCYMPGIPGTADVIIPGTPGTPAVGDIPATPGTPTITIPGTPGTPGFWYPCP